jgi:hypothetical protein
MFDPSEWLANVRADLRRIEELRHDIWKLEQFQQRSECSHNEFQWAKHQINSMHHELIELGDA